MSKTIGWMTQPFKGKRRKFMLPLTPKQAGMLGIRKPGKKGAMIHLHGELKKKQRGFEDVKNPFEKMLDDAIRPGWQEDPVAVRSIKMASRHQSYFS